MRLAFLLLLSASAYAACTGSPPSQTTTPDQASFTTCWNAAASQSVAQSVAVLAGSATWTGAWTGSTATPSITVTGATACTGSGDPTGGTSGVVTCTDSTTITLNASAQLAPTGCLTRITGMTFIGGYNNSNGLIQLFGTYGSVCARFDHNHIKSAFEVPLTVFGTYGLIDHNLIEDTSTMGNGPQLVGADGDLATNGYQDWINATNLGTNQAVILEQNQFTSTNGATPYGAYDAHAGAKMVFRFNTVGLNMGVTHGTDSGGQRSAVSNELYGNAISGPGSPSQNIFGIRGGTLLVWGNTVASSPWKGVQLSYYRVTGQSNSASWGRAATGLNWTPVSATDTSANATVATLNAADWQANHSYAANTFIGPTSNNAGSYNYQNQGGTCTSGGSWPGTFSQTFPAGTTSDNTCTWTNVGGSTAASPSPGTAAGFLSTAPDTPCSAGGTCTYYLDSLGGSAGSYPFRDQPGRGHNQTPLPCYEWLNTGASIPSPLFVPDSGLSGAVVNNQDYYTYTGSFNGTSGVGSGTLASRPATCTAGVAYWATDQGAWNVSGNGKGSGVLYQCSSTNTWTSYYTPYTYPDPLQGISVGTSSGGALSRGGPVVGN